MARNINVPFGIQENPRKEKKKKKMILIMISNEGLKKK